MSQITVKCISFTYKIL